MVSASPSLRPLPAASWVNAASDTLPSASRWPRVAADAVDVTAASAAAAKGWD